MNAPEARSAPLDVRVRKKAGTDRLGDQLVGEGLITRAQLERALAHQKRTGRRIGETLFEMGMISSPDLTRVLAQRRGIPFADLTTTHIDPTVARMIPVAMARSNGFVPLHTEGETIVLAMVNPEDGEGLGSVRTFLSGPVRAVMCDPEGLLTVIESVWPDAEEVSPLATQDEATIIARDLSLYRLAARQLGQGDAMWSGDELLAWREVLLLHAYHLVQFLTGDPDLKLPATAFVPGWPGEQPKLQDALARLGALRGWLRESLARPTSDVQQDQTRDARIDDLRRDLDRVHSAFLAALSTSSRDWFVA